ncbi:methionyl-tRNA formyltransferase [Spiroplasma tabanidicola]|uniref:Methionyl-tRNA formyltransferase n=1 Tax=Spiroplasma tabanidicola TaxID=324079 RepID=A0A6I6CA53_9MOLU|nr:methionyl-tRNA formyltransferase [Spiroplasma tabanidicola]QGS51791.1 methionyl-tRNA formyltransferase [Spiroplasma tabanidicola]
MKYKVIFCGTPPIAVEVLKGLEALNLEIVCVITQPDKMVGRKKVLTPSVVKGYALVKNYNILQPANIKDAFEEIKKYNADFLLTCAFGQFIPENILSLFKNSINVHGSILPKYRGGSPIQYAIMNGDKQTGISLMKMIKKMDAGEVYKTELIDILDEDDSGSLFEKMGKLANQMIQKYLIDIFEKKIVGVAQDESQATFAYNLSNEQEKIDWSKSNIEVLNFIRSQSPLPIAFTYLGDERIKIKKARLVKDDEKYISLLKIFQPGEIIYLDKEGIIVQTGQGIIKILELQRAGKKMGSAGIYKFENSPFLPTCMFK